MKKILVVIGITFSFLTTNGQNNIEYGLKGGLNYSNFIDTNTDDIPADYAGKIGFHLGGFVVFGINDAFSIRPELLYSQQRSKFNINTADLNIFNPNDELFITSLDGQIEESLFLLPIIVEYSLTKKFSLEFGPQFGFSLNRKIEYDDNFFGIGLLRNDDSEKFELGLSLGLGYSLVNDLGISIRYNYGIIERQNLNTSVVQLGINYTL